MFYVTNFEYATNHHVNDLIINYIVPPRIHFVQFFIILFLGEQTRICGQTFLS